MNSTKHTFFIIFSIVIAVFFVFGVQSVDAQTFTAVEQQELAAMASQLASLQAFLDSLANSLFYGASAQTTCSAENPSGCTTEAECTAIAYFWCSSVCYSTTLECSGGSTTGSCPAGFHYHSESGGFCINDSEDYSGTCYDSTGASVITCPSGTYASCTGTTDATCTTESGCAWDASSNFCYSSSSGTTACNYNGVCESGESSGSCPGDCSTTTTDTCPSGYHYHSESGGFCINDQEDYSGTCYDSAGTTLITCPSSTTTSGCGTNVTEATCTTTSGCAWDTTGAYCYVSGTPTTTDTCPYGYHYHSDSGGYCINDQENYSGTCYDSAGTNVITCPTYTTPTSSSCIGQPDNSSCLAAGSQCRWYQLIDGSAYCDDEPHTPAQTSCDNSGTCDASETADFCPLDCGTEDTVTLSSVAISGDQVTVSYSKNFATCVHLLTPSSVITHTNNFYCNEGNNVSVTQPLSAFTSVTSGQLLKLCHGNNYGVCSGTVSVSEAAMACDYDGTCDAGESYSTCPNDCSLPTTPVISNIQVSEITTSSATIGWTTDRPTTSKIEYWVTTVTGDFVEDAAFTASHQLTLTGLQSGTTYTYNVVSRDSNFYTAYAYNKTFKTLSPAQADTVPPTVISFGSYVDSFDGKLHANAGFSEPIDQTTLNSSNVFMQFASSGTLFSTSSSSIIPNSSSVDYTDFVPPDPATGFELVIKNVKDVVGNTMSGTYVSPIFYWSYSSTPGGGSCPLGYHYHPESGGFCINDQENYSGTCYDSTGVTVITCPSDGSYCNSYITEAMCTLDGGCSWEAASNYCYDSYQGGGNCPFGYHYHSDSGGYCINDQENYSGTCYDSAGAAVISCPSTTTPGIAPQVVIDVLPGAHEHWNDAGVTTYLGSDEDSFAVYDTFTVTILRQGKCSTDANPPQGCSAAPVISGSCPSGFHFHYEDGGFCINDQENYSGTCYDSAGTTLIACPQPTSTYCPPPSYWDPALNTCVGGGVGIGCPLGYHYHSESGGFCINDQENYSGTCYDSAGTDTIQCPQTITADTSPPWVDFSQSSPREGDRNISTKGKVNIVFNEPVDGSLIGNTTFILVRDSDSGSVAGNFEFTGNGFTYIPIKGLTAGAFYTWKLLPGIKDVAGNETSGEYSARFQTSSSVTITEPGILTGTVTDGTGAAVTKAFVQLNDFSYTFWKGTETTASGTYKMVDIPSGSYRLSVYPPPNKPNLISPAETSVTLEAGDTLIKNLAFLATTKTITGSVTASDGTVITDARVNAWRRDGPGNADAKVDSKGRFFLSVAGGSWEVGIWPEDYSKATWTYDDRTIVQFANDSTVETKTVNLTVLRQNAKIVGKVVNPDGTAAKPSDVSISVDASNRGYPVPPLSSTGLFSVSVAAGTYEVRVWPSNPEFKVAPISVTVGEFQTKDLGTIRLQKPLEKITGQVRDAFGNPVAGVGVNGWQERGGGGAWNTTDKTGTYTLSVTPGIWSVSVELQPSSQYASFDPPVEVDVKRGGTSKLNFTVVKVDSFISGTIQDSSGAVINDIYGYVYVETEDPFGFGGFYGGYGSGFGGPVDRGTFQFRVPAGTHTIVFDTPPGSDWGSASPRSVTVANGETAKTNFIVRKKSSEISGLVVDASGAAITGRSMRVFASGKGDVWQEGFVDYATGKYSLKIAAGTWFVNVDPGGYGTAIFGGGQTIYQSGDDVKVVVGEGEKVTQNITLTTSDATISGSVKKSDGSPLPYVWVSVDSESFSAFEKESFASQIFDDRRDYLSFGTETDSKGAFTLSVPAGTYYVHAFIPYRERVINPEEEKVVVETGGSATVDLVARLSDIALSGTVFRGEDVSNGFVSGWSEKGGYVETLASANGSYSVNIAGGDIWHFYAARNFEGEWYRSSEATISVVDEAAVTQDFVMIRERSLPPPVTTTVEADKASVVKTDDGAKVALPAQSTGTSGSVSVSVEPDPEVPQQGNSKVVGVGYDVSVRDEVGKEVTKLNSTITITIPYTDEDLEKLGLTPKELKVAFWDENAGVWRELAASIVNEDEKTVTAVVDHLTRFAIVAAADILPPNPPSGVVIAAAGAGKIDISWTKPVKDFSHVKIYRSSVVNELGKVRFAEVFDNKVTDTGVTDGVTYYYTIRSVDPAGNESGNKEQNLVVAVGTSVASDKTVLLVGEKKEAPKAVRKTIPTVSAPVAVTGATFSRSLTVGMSGSDVTTLQQILVSEGVYPEAITSGYFGALTKAAVIRFQDKYASEVLVPAGLNAGTGYVGPSTIKKLNALSGGGVSAPAPVSAPAAVVTPSGGALTRNLKVGISGDDVATLQQLLVDEGVYPEAIVSGYFGSLTEAAVIRFQEKYAAEILTPVDLTSGSGYVGASTRAKANALLGQ